MEDIFALVYVDYEGLLLLEMGEKEFVLQKYNESKQQIEEYNSKMEPYFDLFYDDLPEEVQEYKSNHRFASMDDAQRLCVMGYKDSEIKCVCKDFGIDLEEPIFY